MDFQNIYNYGDLFWKHFEHGRHNEGKNYFYGNLAFGEFAKAKLENFLRSKCQDLQAAAGQY